MKLFSLRLTTLKSKLYAIVFASFVVRIVAFFALPNTPSALGPDEGTYAAAANWTALGKPATYFPDFGAGLYVSGRTLLIPAAFFNLIGLNPLDSVRLTSSLYGVLVVLIIALATVRLISKYPVIEEFINQNHKAILGLFSIFTFLPSHFFWSVLGLRESATEFWVVSTFITLFLSLTTTRNKHPICILSFFLSIVMVFCSRPQVGWTIGLSLTLFLLFRSKVTTRWLLLSVTLIGILLGYVVTVERQLLPTSNLYAQIHVDNTPTTKATPTTVDREVSLKCEFEGQIVRISGNEYDCLIKPGGESKNEIKNPGSVLIDQSSNLAERHRINKIGAASAIQTLDCPFDPAETLGKYLCLVYRAPYTTLTFLFRPMLFVDVTSASSFLAAAENFFWTIAIFFIVVMLSRNRKLVFFRELEPSLIFFSIFTVAAGAYEGNMGTAFRHKSLILWVVILLLASTIVATKERKAENRELAS